MEHVRGQLEKAGTWRDGEKYKVSLHDAEHWQLFIGECYKKEGRHIKNDQLAINQ